MNNIQEGNKKIALYLGGEVRSIYKSPTHEDFAWIGEIAHQWRKEKLGIKIGEAILVDQLKFHSSWDWLMEVWAKAGKQLYEVRGNLTQQDYWSANAITKTFLEGCQKSDIDMAHAAIVDAVELLNDYQSPTK